MYFSLKELSVSSEGRGPRVWQDGAMSDGQISRRTIERVAENRILQAIEEGQLDGLPGLGRPIPDIDEPYDPDWWVKSWIRREQLGRALAGKP